MEPTLKPTISEPGKDVIVSVMSDDIEAVVKWLQEGGSTDQCNEQGHSLLQLANSPAMLDLLIANGANPDTLQPCGDTALTFHIQKASPACVLDMLLKHTDTAIPDKNGFTPLHHAIKENRVSVLRQVLNHGADPALGNEHSGESPLHLAARRGADDMVQILLAANVPVSPLKKTGETPLHLAAWSRDTATAFHLLRAGANVLSRSKSGSTALHWAAERGDKDMIILLLVGGADPLQRDHFGLSSVMVAEKRCGEEVSSLFSQYAKHTLPTLQYMARQVVLWKVPTFELENLPQPLRDYLTATDYQLMKSNMM